MPNRSIKVEYDVRYYRRLKTLTLRKAFYNFEAETFPEYGELSLRRFLVAPLTCRSKPVGKNFLLHRRSLVQVCFWKTPWHWKLIESVNLNQGPNWATENEDRSALINWKVNNGWKVESQKTVDGSIREVTSSVELSLWFCDSILGTIEQNWPHWYWENSKLK